MQAAKLIVPAERRMAGAASRSVQSFVEAFGMPSGVGLSLALAAEEIISFAADNGDPEDTVTLVCRDGGYRMVLEITFSAKDFDPRLFNLTRTVSLEDERDLTELGLLLTARAVDRFDLSSDGGQTKLVLECLRPYPSISPSVPLQEESASDWILKPLEEDHIAGLCRLAATGKRTPAFLLQPGRIIDMFVLGEIAGSVVERVNGGIAGGCLWEKGESNIAECFGPYVSTKAEGAAAPLVEACLMALARSSASGLLCRHPEKQFPGSLFDRLGHSASGPVFYRELQEDMGAAVWTTPEIENFMSATYERLGYARELKHHGETGRRRPEHSVISVVTHRDKATAILRPGWPGADAEQNVANHLRHLVAGGFGYLRFEIDLKTSWQLDFVPGLLRAGFEPSYIIPDANSGDTLVFTFEAGEGA